MTALAGALPARVAAARTLCERIGGAFSDEHLVRILRVCRWDADLAYTALKMEPRPAWVTEIVHTDLACEAF